MFSVHLRGSRVPRCVAQVNPIWLYGPNEAGTITAGAVPGWYMGFLDGALRIMPNWEFSVFGHPLTLAVLVPAVVFPAASSPSWPPTR